MKEKLVTISFRAKPDHYDLYIAKAADALTKIRTAEIDYGKMQCGDVEVHVEELSGGK